MSRVLLVLWSVCIVYGSFIPFRLTTDSGIARPHLAKAWLLPFVDGRRDFSVPDVVSNVLLYIPFGILLMASIGGASGKRRPWRFVLCGVIAAVFSTLVEGGRSRS